MTRKEKKYLFDISESVRIIFDEYLPEASTLEDFEAHKMVQDAVDRRLIVIGEAIFRLRQMGVHLVHADQLINRRNTIIHQYDDYNPETIWRSLFRDLPPLKEEADRLLG